MIDCAIIGAGAAGLVAATELAERGFTVVVLEARDRVGGRLETGLLSDGTAVDLGGQWVADVHTRTLALLDECGLTLAPASRGDLTVRLGGMITTVPSRGEIESSLNPFEVADLGQGLTRFRRLAERTGRDAAWATSNTAWLTQPLARWVRSNLRTPGGQAWFARVFRAAFGVEVDESTLADGLARANTGVDMESLIAVNGGITQQRVAGGLAQLPEVLAQRLGDRVRLGAPVVGVDTSGDHVVVTLRDGSSVEARAAVVALPPALAVELEFTPELEPWRFEAAAKVPRGSVIKAVAAYPSPWWREAGFSGQMGADEGPVRVLFDASPDDGAGVLTGFFGAAPEASLADRSPGLRQRALAEAITTAFGPGPDMTEYMERDWRAEEFTGGCHGAHFAPGVWTATGPALAEPHGEVHFAGAEFARRFNGYLEGALRSGHDVAVEVARQLG